MASSVQALPSQKYQSHLRPVDTYQDLGAVADLIEICFKDTLDPDGQSYLKRLRDAARFSYLSNWAASLVEEASILPLSGYVWVEDRQIVGNLSLIPFHSLGQRNYLIANVAVLPAFRGRGIGTRLTERALEHVQEHHGASAWLQVRDDNPAAIHIYETLGFQERARRTTWVNTLPIQGESPDPYVIGARFSAHWVMQRAWLQRLYPAEFAWHLPVHWKAIQPGWSGEIYRFLNLTYPKHWTVSERDELCGILTWMSHPGYADYLLLAAPETANAAAIQALLGHVRKSLSSRRRLSLNTPAGFVDEAMPAAGFTAQQTLIWMEVNYSSLPYNLR
jgi:ribosomal protein S18 acetylase RimI-like enzyme